jgi:hypothetical protein
MERNDVDSGDDDFSSLPSVLFSSSKEIDTGLYIREECVRA